MNSDDILQHTRENAVNGEREQQLAVENYRFNKAQVPVQIEATQNTTNKYLTIFNNMEQGFCIIEVLFDDTGKATDYRFLETNPVFEKQTGLQNAVGKTMKELEPGQEEHWFQMYGDVVKTGKSVHFEREASNLIGGVWYEVFAVPIEKPEKKQVAVFFNDITERKRAEDRHAFLIKLNDALRQIGDPVRVQAVAADLLGVHLKANQSHYAEVAGDYICISHSYCDGLPPMTGKFRHQDFEGLVEGYRAGKVQVCNDTTADAAISNAERVVLVQANIGAYVTVPLVKDGEWVATLAVHNIKPRCWKQNEIDLVQEVAERTWEVVERAKAEELLTKELEDTKKLQQFSNRIIEENDIEALYEALMESAINIMHADTASIQTVEPQINELLLLTHKGFHPRSAETWRRITINSTTSCGLALAKGERIVFADVDDAAIEISEADREAYRLSGIIAMQSTPLVSRSGKPLGMISTHWKKKHQPSARELNLFDVLARHAADIIEQKLAEEALRESQARMSQLLSLMPAAVYTCDAEGRITFFNRRAAELWGREPKLNDVQQKFCGSFRMWSQDGTLLMHESCPMADAILGGHAVRDLELVVEQPSGVRLVVNVNIDPLFDANGKLIGAINVFTDITERKRAEKALHESEAWLNGQKEAFQAAMSGQSLATSLEALIDTVTVQTGGEARASFYLIPPGGQGLHLVAGMSDEYGHDINGFKVGPESLACGLAMHTGETVITPDVELDPVWEPWLPIARKHNYRASWSFPVRTAGGPVVGTFAMYFEQPRNPTARELELAGIVAHAAAIIISRDTELNERTEAENALRKNEVHLKQLLKQKDEFIGIASHELKTPITSMKTYAEIMMEAFEETGDSMSATLMEKLHKQIDRLTSLTKDLLDTGKISEGQLQLFVEEADLNALISERLEELKRISAIHKILFNAGELKPVVLDKERIGQVITNLVSNAMKYSPDGGEVIVSTQMDENNQVTVSVQDYGIGISNSEQHRVFERFYRVNNVKNQNFSGMGLGLYISSQIVNRHGGNMNVQSEEGKGSTFSFSLPAE